MKPQTWMLLALFLSVFTLSAADWPQWRGPQRNGISEEKGLLQEWPKEGPKLLWQVTDVGLGYSTPAVVGERLYLMSNEGTENESVQARELKDGGLAWTTRIGKVGNPQQIPPYPGARSTPTVDGAFVFALGSDGDLACLDKESGKVKWQKSLRDDFGGQPGKWAYAESPLIDGDVLVCTPGGKKGTLVALNKQSGEVLWQSVVPGGDDAGYASVVVVDAGGIKQYVQFLANGLVGVDAKSGKFLWRYDKTASGSPANIPTPVAYDYFVYSAAGKSGGGLVKLNITQESVEAVQKYFSPKLPTSIGGSVKVGNYLYGTNSAGLLCAEFETGELKWQDRSVGAGSVCFADGRIYVHGEKGDVALVEASPDGYREKGRFSPPGQPDRGKSQAWAYPVVSNGRLFLRDFGVIWCYDLKP